MNSKKEYSTIKFLASGVTAKLYPDDTILETAEREGVEALSCCRYGNCGRCQIRLVSGEVTMLCELALDPTDKADGFILACQAKSTGDIEVNL